MDGVLPLASLSAILGLRAERTPDRTAYIFLAEGEEEQDRRTYAALDAQARAIASALTRSCRPGDRALLLYPPGLDFVAAFFGCLYAGVIAVPAYPPRSPRMMPRLLAILADAQPAIALAPAAAMRRVLGWLERTPEAAALSWLATDELDPAPAGWEPAATPGEAVAFLQYTSGSTATPKGVMVTHDNLLHNQALIRDACGHSERSVFVSWLPPYHDLGLIGNLLQAAFVGGSCVLMSPTAFLQRPARWLQAVSRYGATTSGGPNFAWDLCVRKVSPEQRRTLDLSCWEVAFNGAEPVRAETLDRFAAAFADCGFRSGAFYPCYGLAEATLMVSGGRPGAEPVVRSFAVEALAAGRAVAARSEEVRQSRLVSCGAVLAGQEVAIVDPATGKRRGAAEVGEIWLCGPSVAAGYWRRPEETAATFGARLTDGTGPFLRTGDLGFFAGGELFIAGRLKDLIILRGRNLYPQDLEATAQASHPALAGGLAAAFSVERAGEERLVLVQELGSRRAAVDAEAAAEAIRRTVAEEHEAHVEEVVLIAAGTLPRTSSGKVQRSLCRDLLLNGELEVRGRSVLAASAGEEAETVLSREELLALPSEQRSAGLEGWLRRRIARAAGVAPARLRPDAPLSELGLDSLMAAEVKNDLEEGLGITLPLAAFLEGPTLRQLTQSGLEGLDETLAAGPALSVPEPSSAGAADDLPLAPVQEAIWFLQRLAPESAAYNIAFATRLPSTIDAGALGRALCGLVARHAALRTTFGEREGRPFQRQGPPPAAILAEVDAAGWSEEELLAGVTEAANRPFDLAIEPALRALLYRGGASGPVLLLTVHHLALDGRSLWRLVEELGERYQAELSGRILVAPPAAGYRDFVAWQRALLAGPEGERLTRFWGRLRGTPALELPTDRPRGTAGAAPAGATVRFLVERPLASALRALAAAQRTTLFTVALAAFEAFLYRWSGQEEFLLGTAVWGRSRREFEEVIGGFFNVVALAAEVGPARAFTDHLRQVQATVHGAIEHQDYPSHRLAGDLDMGASRLFPAVLLWQRPQWVGGASELTLGETGWRLVVHGLELEPLPVERRFARQEVELEVLDAGEVLAAALHYDADLFGSATALRMARHLQVLLAAVAAAPEAALCDLPLLGADEERLLRDDLNDLRKAERTYALPVAVQDLFIRQARGTPDRIAAVDPSGAMSYGELEQRSAGLAALIQRVSWGREAGAPLDRLVGILADPGPQALAGLLGVLAAGGGFVPIDPRYPDERVAWILEDCACQVLVTQRRHLARAVGLARGAAGLRDIVCLDGEAGDVGISDGVTVHAFDARGEEAGGQAGLHRDPRELRSVAYVVYTSGSTGRPKGVPVSHENLVPMLAWGCEHLGLGEGTRVLQSLSFCFDFGIFEQLTTVLAGGTLGFAAEAAGDPAAFAREIVRHGVNTLHTTPAFARELAGSGGPDGALDGLEIVHLGGETLSRDTVARIRAAAPRATVYNGYGPTEATVNSSIFRIGGAQEAVWPVVPIGRRSADNALYVLDRAGRLVPFGARGELHVGGIGVARGYLNRPDLTAGRFVPDPFAASPGGRLYRTGDLVRYLPEGDIEFLGRIDQQVKIRGFRVEPGEIEAALREHPAVREAAVVARPEPSGDLRLVAYLVSDDELMMPELRSFLARRLPPHMVPPAFVFLPALPLTSSGKVDRRALPAPAAAQTAAPYAAPRTPLEAALAGIWSRGLGVERVGIHDDFFELGGHSLLGTRIIAQIRKELGVEVALRTFFESSTIAELARAVEGAGRVDLPPIRPVPKDGELPLSFPQERIWFLTQLDPNLLAYHVPRALRVRGRLDPALVEVTFSEINRRHEILRTTFPAIDGRPVQVIQPPFRMFLPVVDLSVLPIEVREEELRRRILVEGRRHFDLVRGPLLRLTLLRLAPEEHALVITEHHLVHDGWTQGVLLRDFLTIYGAFSRGEPSPLPELPVQYADFAVWQRRWLRDEVMGRQLAYWKERLAGAPAVLDLPADRPRPAVQSFQGAQVTWVLPAELSRALRAASRRLGATLFMTMLAAWNTLLMRLSGQEDLCIGTGVANRRVVEAEGLLGMVINTLVLRADLSSDPTFAELVARLREVCVGAYGHQDLPFEKLVNALRLERSLSHTPLFQVFFAFMDTPMPELELPGLSISVLDAHNRSAKFDINVTVLLPNEQRVGLEGAREDEITLLFEYSTDLFERTTVLRMLEQFQVLLTAAVEAPGLTLSRLSLLTAAQAHQLRFEWNDSVAPSAADLCLHDLVFAQARRTPQAPAVRCGEERLTYEELAGRARRLAEHLRAQGIAPGDLIGLAVDRSEEMVVALLGVLTAGAAYVPLDPTYPRERLALMVEDSRPTLLLTQERLAEALPQGTPLFFLERAGSEPAGVLAEPARPTPGDLAYVLYTSGSTGRPKGVAIPHRAVVNFLAAVRRRPGLAAHDALLALTTLSFDIAVLEIFLPLAVGATVVVARREQAHSGAELRAALADPAITVVQATPATWRLLLESGWEGSARLKALCGGEALPRELAESLLQRCGELWNMYGPTETTVWSMAQRVVAGWEGAGPVPVGRPLGSTCVHLLDRDSNPVPLGVPGELWIGGAGLALGYLRRPDLTAAAFRPDPLATEPGARLYRTGDLARRLPDGTVEFLGRIDHQVKVRGFRIELAEIEAHLSRHPAVQAAVAAVYEATPGDRRIAAYLVGASQPAPAADELRRFLAESLPEYMLPTAWVWLAALPLTPNGKVDRKALPRPEADRSGLATAFVAPRNEMERALAAAWCEVLGTQEVGAHDNFFDRGGHSLLGTRLMARIESRLDVVLPLRTLFEAPTVALLAEKVEQALGREADHRPAPPLVAGLRPAELPLSFAQERLWLLDQIDGPSAAYNIPCAVHLAGALDPAALGRALDEVVHRHEALRTRFEAAAGEPRQVIEPSRPLPLPIVDLTGTSEAEALRLAKAEAVRPFELTRPPLLRACLLRRGAEDHLLVLTLHHIAADGWSVGVLVRELAIFYQGETLADLPIQYADFALWQRQWLSSETLAQEIAWWRERLAGAPEEIPLPTDRPRTAAPSNRGGTCRTILPLAAELDTLCREQQATLFMVLLAAFAALLGRWSGAEDLVVGSPVANRNRVETEGLIGFFVNMLPLRVDLAGQPSFAALLGRVRQGALEAYAHQDLPFEKLVEVLQPTRHLGRTPLFQVSFALQNAPFAAVEVPGLSWSPLPLATETAKFDLSLSLTEEGEAIAAALEYGTDLFDGTTAERLLGHFERLLEAALDAAGGRLGELPLLSAAERHAVVIESNDTARCLGEDRTIHRIFEERAAAAPDTPALVVGQECLTFRELNRRANAIAHWLKRQGVGPESRVGLAAEPSSDAIAGLLGILKAGGAYVPIDPAYPTERLRWLLADSGASLLLTPERLFPHLAELEAGCLMPLDQEALLALESTADPDSGVAPDNAAYVLYTSGSTGRPKGVVVRHGSVLNLARAHLSGIFGGDPRPLRVGLNASLTFDGSVLQLVQLLWGHTVCLIPEEARLDPSALVELVRRERLDVLDCTPSQLRLLLASGLTADPQDGPRLVLVGGEPLDREIRESTRSRPWTCFVNVYGPTECTVDATACPFPAMVTPAALGRPLANVRVYVVDGEGGSRPAGFPGEIWIGGAGLARGYLGRPDLTAERFVPDPFGGETGARLYRSGDRARRLADGSLDFLGRVDHQVKIRGFRVELGEIEATLSAHPAVREAVVVAKGEGAEKRLVAYVVPATGERDLGGLLRVHLRKILPNYMMPAAFVEVESLPLMSSGKVDRQTLARSGPEPQGAASHNEVPRTPIEKLLADIWAEVLGLERIGIHDGFFDLGGHSLLAARVVSRLRGALGVELPLRALFERPSVAELAHHLDDLARQSRGLAAPPLERVSRSLEPPLSFAQQSLWLIDRIEGGSAAYNMTATVELAGRLDIAGLAESFQEVVERHEVLRTSFILRDGEPRQVIHPRMEVPLPVVDVSALSDSRRQEARNAVHRELQRPFDLGKAPLLRPALLRLAPDLHILELCQHHIVSDAWSMGVLVRELAACYKARVRGGRAALPPLPVQYADYADWQRRWLRGEALETLLAFWRRQLGDHPPAARPPALRPAPAVRTHRGGSRTFLLPAGLEPALRALARREGMTLFMLLLGVFQTLLHRSTQQEDLVLVVAVSGRDRLETEGLIGCFLNMLPLRTSLAGDPSFRQLLQRVRETCLEAFAHQDLPFERLVAELRLREADGRSPFQVAFGVQSAPPPLPELPELAVHPLASESEAARLDLTLWITERPEGLSAAWTYSCDLFEREEVERLHGLYEALLAAVVANPDARLRELALAVAPQRDSESAPRRRWEDVKQRKFREARRRSVRG